MCPIPTTQVSDTPQSRGLTFSEASTETSGVSARCARDVRITSCPYRHRDASMYVVDLETLEQRERHSATTGNTHDSPTVPPCAEHVRSHRRLVSSRTGE